MIELRDDEVVFRFPEVHADAVCRIGFQRTLRIPDDNRDYPCRRPRPVPPPARGRPCRPRPGGLGPARRRLPAHVPGRGDVAAFRRPVSDGRQGGGRKDRRPDRRGLDERPLRAAPELPGGARAAVAGRLLRREGADSSVRRHAPRRRLHGRGAVDRRGAARRAAACRVPDAGREVRGVAGRATGNGPARMLFHAAGRPNEHGSGARRSHAPGDPRGPPRGPPRLRGVGPVGAFPVFSSTS